MLNSEVQLCPYPDCESYAKKGKNKYVTCIHNGHNFCYKCLKNWHGKESCKIDKDKSFEKWRNSYNVKKCPQCKYFIEKNEGCNHIKCINCNYEFCWLCLNKYKSGHFDLDGKCFGLQYANCLCFSNRLCLCLYKLLIIFVKFLLFALFGSFGFFIALHIKLYDKLDFRIKYSCTDLASFSSIIILCISFGILLISITSLISIIILIIFPLQDIVILALLDMF